MLEVVDWTPIGDMKDAWNCGIWIGGGIAGTDPDDQPYVNF